MDRPILVLSTVPSMETATETARTLVQEKLAACTNIIQGMRSIYRWKHEIHDEPELLLIIKSREDLFPAVRDRIISLHPYEVPEIISLPVEQGSEDYLSWLLNSLRP